MFIGFLFVTPFALLAAIIIVRHRQSHKQPFRPAVIIWPIIQRTAICIAPYGLAFWFYDNVSLPYDANWTMISGLCLIGLMHFSLTNLFMKPFRCPEAARAHPAEEAELLP